MNPDPPGPGAAAFFDLDRTILRVNSASLWIQYERRAGRLTRSQMVTTGAWLAGYHLGLLNMERVLLRAIGALKGADAAQLEARTRAWYTEMVSDTILPKAREAIQSHRCRGHAVVLLTTSSTYLSDRVQEELAFDQVLCTRFEAIDGILTGRVEGPLCYGQGKVVQAREWAESKGVSLASSYFYTDSMTDLPMLEVVGHPHATNPDPRLRRLAIRRGWPVLVWT